MKRAGWLAVVVLGALALPRLAEAGNATHPRTPVLWIDTPCLTVIDRSQDPIHQLGYAIPYEDTEVTPDEVVDSRTHQFFAFCRQHHLEELLPSWINASEIEAAMMNGLTPRGLDPVDPVLDVLSNNPEWADCFVRITDDDERRPITFAAAAEPVPWDTSALPVGTYVVEGYTYEPWFNAWWPRPGVFKVVDDPDPAASPPAAAITDGEQLVEYGDEAIVSGCIDAAPGSTMSVWWARSGFGMEPDWQPIVSDVAVENGAFEVPFAPPQETISYSLMTRVEVVDPQDRSWTAYSHEYISVIEGSGGEAGSDGCEEGGFIVNPCAEDGDDTTGGDTHSDESEAGEGESESGPALAGGESGCGCTGVEPSAGWLGLLALLGLVGLRRRASAC